MLRFVVGGWPLLVERGGGRGWEGERGEEEGEGRGGKEEGG